MILVGVPGDPFEIEGGELQMAACNYFTQINFIAYIIIIIIPKQVDRVSQFPLARHNTVADPDNWYPVLQV